MSVGINIAEDPQVLQLGTRIFVIFVEEKEQ
jgi:3D (Asp-Asp-Asp) domain-containing protein